MSIDIQSGGDEAEGQDESDERLHDWYWSLSRGSSPVECDLSGGFFRIYRKFGGLISIVRVAGMRRHERLKKFNSLTRFRQSDSGHL